MFDRRLPAVQEMDFRYLARNDGSEQATGRGSGLQEAQEDRVQTKGPMQGQAVRGRTRAKTPYMQMAFHPLERRLDTAIFRAMFASSSKQAMDIQALSVRGICEALRWSDLWLVCLRTRRLLSPIQSSQSPRKMPAGVLDFSGQLSGISRAFRFLQPASQRATVERGQTRRNKVPTPRIASCTSTHCAHDTSLRTIQSFRLA
jgi:hypothetical protein